MSRPNRQLTVHSPTFASIEDWLAVAIEPYVRMHGGAVRIASYTTDPNILALELSGACNTCPFVMMTVQYGIKQRFKETFGAEYMPVEIRVTTVS